MFNKVLTNFKNYFTLNLAKKNKALRGEVEVLEELIKEKEEIPMIFFDKDIKKDLSITDKDLVKIKESYENAGEYLNVMEKIMLVEIIRNTKLATDLAIKIEDREKAVVMIDCYRFIISVMTRGKFFKAKKKEEKKSLIL